MTHPAKVAHLTSVHPWNDTRIFQRMCRALAEAGWEVHLVAPCHQQPDSAATQPVHLHPIPLPAGGRLQRMTQTVDAVLQCACEIDAQIYHLHDPELLRAGLRLLRRGKKVIYDIHEDLPATITDKPWLPHWLGSLAARPVGQVERLWARRMSAIIGAEEALTDRLRRPGQPAMTVHNYPRLADFPRPDDLRERTRSNILVSFGGLNRHRAADTILRALSHLDAEYDYRLIFAGRTADETFLESLRSLNAFSRMENLGRVTAEQLRHYLYQARMAFVLYSPSPNHQRVRSNRFFEAMAAGVPVITSNFPHWLETVQRLGCGLAVSPEDPRDVAEAVRTLWNHPGQAIAMGQRGREAVEQLYNWEFESRRLTDLYRELLGN